MNVQDLPLIDPDHCFICGIGLLMFNTLPLMISEDGKGLLSLCMECQPNADYEKCNPVFI